MASNFINAEMESGVNTIEQRLRSFSCKYISTKETDKKLHYKYIDINTY